MEVLTIMSNNKYLTKITAASLLGDGGIYIPTSTRSINGRFYIAQIEDHKDYLDWLADKHATIAKTTIYGPYSVKCPQCVNPKKQYRLQTAQIPFYTKFRQRMYPQGKKVIDPHYLTQLDYEFLAIWYQEDGTYISCLERKDYVRERIQLASMSFSYAENLLLREALKEKLNLIWNIRRVKSKSGGFLYQLELYKKQYDVFINGVMPYIQPSFMYKVTRKDKLSLEMKK